MRITKKAAMAAENIVFKDAFKLYLAMKLVVQRMIKPTKKEAIISETVPSKKIAKAPAPIPPKNMVTKKS